MTGREVLDPRVESFAGLAREYVRLIDRASELDPLELLGSCLKLLPRLYADALDLPDMEPTNRPTGELASPFKTLERILGPGDWYWMVFDPYEVPEAHLVGSLADDLADIYLDLGRPLADFDAGAFGDAAWGWRFNMRMHAGEHVIGAMGAIHWIVHSHGWPPSKPDAQAGK